MFNGTRGKSIEGKLTGLLGPDYARILHMPGKSAGIGCQSQFNCINCRILAGRLYPSPNWKSIGFSLHES